ncbi:MAG: EamA family transporter [Anaerolineae bacterium]|nr:EamA family transporter [Phycisphaerae bacterium]
MHATVKPGAETHRRSQRIASLMLLIATLCWGCGFTWAKAGGETINRITGVGDGAPLGPILLLAARFIVAGLAWFAIFPAARRGWTLRSCWHAFAIGFLLATGSIAQHLGLDQTSEAVCAFLTSLTIVFVPLLSTLALRRSPPLRVWIAVVIALAGVWLMTGAAPGGGFGLGEWLGLATAIIFSIYVLVVNDIVPRDNPFRMAGGQFLVTGLIALATVPFLRGGVEALHPTTLVHIFQPCEVWMNWALLIIVPTLIAYGILTIYQPRLDATRAALLYLMEPLFAAVYAYVIVNRSLLPIQLLGAATILIANLLVELLEMHARGGKETIEHAPREMV